jgi:hypothetical protein
MLERIHQHILAELGSGSRTDTIFVVVAVVFNLLVLGINSGAAASASASANFNSGSLVADVILWTFVVMTLLVNAIAIGALLVGRETRAKLLAGLLAMYADSEVAKYYDRSLLSSYSTRYMLFAAVILVLAATGIFVPLVIRLL